MWQLKDKELVKKERRKKCLNPQQPLFLSLFIFSLVGFSKKFNYNRARIHPFGEPISWSQFFKEDFNTCLTIAGICFIVSYILQIISKSQLGDGENIICTKCNKIEVYTKKKKCECAGDFISLDEMTWVDDAKDKNGDTSTTEHN